ncbi:monooxygenase family protein [Sphingomonas sp. RS6]
MQAATLRETVDLSAYPELIVVILGFRLRRLRAIPAMIRIGRGLSALRRSPPDGLLGEDQMLFGWNHVGFRQYWRDLASLEAFTRSAPHSGWWRDFVRDPQGAGFWHEAYGARGIEAVYLNLSGRPVGLAQFAPVVRPVGTLLSTRQRLDAHAGRRAPASE